jgi:hypothetical protein
MMTSQVPNAMYRIFPNIRSQQFKNLNTSVFTNHQLKNLKYELPHILKHPRSKQIVDYIEKNPTCNKSYVTTKNKSKEIILDKYPAYCVTTGCHICTTIAEDISLPIPKKGRYCRKSKTTKKVKHKYSDNCHCYLCDTTRISKKFKTSLDIVRQRKSRFDSQQFAPTHTASTNCPLECYCPIHQKRTQLITRDFNIRGLPFPNTLNVREIDYYETQASTITRAPRATNHTRTNTIVLPRNEFLRLL